MKKWPVASSVKIPEDPVGKKGSTKKLNFAYKTINIAIKRRLNPCVELLWGSRAYQHLKTA